MAKSARAETPQEEAQVVQPTFSFLKLIKKTGQLPSKVVSRSGDPLTIAKTAILKALDEQKGYLTLSEGGKPLPKAKGGKKTVSTWFTKAEDGYWTGIRYGQLSITINGGTGLFIGNAAELQTFYDAVKESIRAGEMDEVIGKLREARSASLKGRTGGGGKKAA